MSSIYWIVSHKETTDGFIGGDYVLFYLILGLSCLVLVVLGFCGDIITFARARKIYISVVLIITLLLAVLYPVLNIHYKKTSPKYVGNYVSFSKLYADNLQEDPQHPGVYLVTSEITLVQEDVDSVARRGEKSNQFVPKGSYCTLISDDKTHDTYCASSLNGISQLYSDISAAKNNKSNDSVPPIVAPVVIPASFTH